MSSRNRYGQCECCRFYYYEKALTRFQFECQDRSHSETYCLECATDHRACRHDYAVATMPSWNDLMQKFKNDETYKEPITPIEYWRHYTLVVIHLIFYFNTIPSPTVKMNTCTVYIHICNFGCTTHNRHAQLSEEKWSLNTNKWQTMLMIQGGKPYTLWYLYIMDFTWHIRLNHLLLTMQQRHHKTSSEE